LVDEDLVHLSSYGDNWYYHKIIFMGEYVFKLDTMKHMEGSVDFSGLFTFRDITALSLFAARHRASTSRESSRNGIQVSKD